MDSLTITYIFLATLFSVLLVYYQYYFRAKRRSSIIILSFLRFLSVFFTLLLLINPQILNRNFETVKPKLLIAIDNSSSIKFANQDAVVYDLFQEINTNGELNNKFDIEYFTFGDHLQMNKVFSFQEDQTNIHKALKELNALVKKDKAPIILISDGNQTYGSDYKHYASKQSIFPVILGDTTQISDLEISRINVNSYTYLNNNFPVEVFINFSGKGGIQTKIAVEKNQKTIYSQNLELSNNKSSVQIQFKLPADKIGKHIYNIRIQPFDNEINTKNNTKKFDIEVIDEQTSIALFYDVLHPDIGVIKRSIESNEQRKVNLINLNESMDYENDHDIFILYQPTIKFQKIMEQVESSDIPIFFITGKNTDWNFLNNSQSYFKKASPLNRESYYPEYNKNFSSFFTEDIGFDDFPPLEDRFGNVEIYEAHQTLLNQKINGITTQNPLLVTFSDNAKRRVALFGENIWKWRTVSYNNKDSFIEFDQFFNSIVQFLSVAKKKNAFELNYKTFYYANEPVKIIVKSYDSNLNFDVNAQLEFFMANDENARPFYLINNSYEIELNDLKSGENHFSVVNKVTKERQNGTFFITAYDVEQEILGSNKKALISLARNSEGLSYYPTQIKDLIQKLLNDQEYFAVQKENKKMISLIDWKWLLGIIILSLSSEWFIRKYKGLI